MAMLGSKKQEQQQQQQQQQEQEQEEVGSKRIKLIALRWTSSTTDQPSSICAVRSVALPASRVKSSINIHRCRAGPGGTLA